MTMYHFQCIAPFLAVFAACAVAYLFSGLM